MDITRGGKSMGGRPNSIIVQNIHNQHEKGQHCMAGVEKTAANKEHLLPSELKNN